MISREQIQAFLAQLRARGVPLDRPMRWEYYLCDHARGPLVRAAGALQARAYVGIELWEPDPSNDDTELMFLRSYVDEVGTVEAIYARCVELRCLAEELGVESFDGFDVSHIDGARLYPGRASS